ncbi:hypothetical protein TNCV_2389781 [Trichonephila clavipes]|nr:hypothetical protein TNCV_2389781 [Trichonephila clavipes]
MRAYDFPIQKLTTPTRIELATVGLRGRNTMAVCVREETPNFNSLSRAFVVPPTTGREKTQAITLYQGISTQVVA